MTWTLCARDEGALSPYIASSEFAEATIAFLEKCNPGRQFFEHNVIDKDKPVFIEINLSTLELGDIPALIEPGLVFDWLSIDGLDPDKPSQTPEVLFPKLTKLLRALGQVHVRSLRIYKFDIPTESLSAEEPKIPLSIGKELQIIEISPSFLGWFCASIDLRACTQGIELELGGCSTKSIKCLDELGIRTLSSLHLNDLPNLKRLDCQMPNRSGFNDGTLFFVRLAKDLDVPAAAAKAIAEQGWKEVYMDMHIWNRVCCLAEKGIVVKDWLYLYVRRLKELQTDRGKQQSALSRVQRLEIHDTIKGELSPTVYLGALMAWLCANAGEVEEIHIRTKSDTATGQELEELRTSATPADFERLSNLKDLSLNGKSVPTK